jgi:Holliday junction resolvase RusA-like endonuclease
MQFTIPIEPKTKKNSQQIVMVNGRPIIIPSKQYKEFEKSALWYIERIGIDYPVNVKALFYMKTRRRVDLTNLLEALDDCLVKGGMLVDDNSQIIVGHDGSRVLYDKNNPRIEVYIEAIGKEI